ncbi:hypothetical protein BOSEA31B_10020 [Hyphomicrobiales bacterium]|nr:hypothetical protein BOSEA31B_10020 [Hyphomicrobiales bacterium]CAH1701699.1 hypothetical protein BOSEA1005_21398 [Hyphomicrobiales bacterium]
MAGIGHWQSGRRGSLLSGDARSPGPALAEGEGWSDPSPRLKTSIVSGLASYVAGAEKPAPNPAA